MYSLPTYKWFAVVLMATTFSCQKAPDSIGVDENILVPMPLVSPSNFPEIFYDTASNFLTKQGFELGRKLFSDVRLSGNNTISCESCHIQTSAFTQHGHNVSHGIDDKLGTRNSQPVMNLAWNTSFFWDGGVFNLDLQPLSPIENPVEMGAKISEVIDKLNADAEYQRMFNRAFGKPTVTSATLMQALSQFMLQCVSANSRYDKFVRNEGEVLNADESQGRQLFEQHCRSCHATDLFTDNLFHNNGLAPTVVNDKGRGVITLRKEDEYLFKTPSLRNLSYSSPYMHDGRFRTLDEVLEHYRSGIVQSATLDDKLKSKMNLTNDEKSKIILFLKTLDDESFVRNEILSDDN